MDRDLARCLDYWRGARRGIGSGVWSAGARVMLRGTSCGDVGASASQRERQARRAASPSRATITRCSQSSRQLWIALDAVGVGRQAGASAERRPA
jgi:hypothetical protein